ncbi:MAG: hypothetical protein J5841_01480 [Clostridia bacterium]|nr:hypothetical protein [Clostridia bacterium]
MEDRKSFLIRIFKEFFEAFGSCVLALCLMTYLMGDRVEEGWTPLFALGAKGIPVNILLQFFLVSVIGVILQNVFLTDKWIKEMSVPLRKLLFFFSVLPVLAACVIVFGWFPVDEPDIWPYFLVSYTVFMGLSTLITRTKEISENKMMQDALEKFKKKKKES